MSGRRILPLLLGDTSSLGRRFGDAERLNLNSTRIWISLESDATGGEEAYGIRRVAMRDVVITEQKHGSGKRAGEAMLPRTNGVRLAIGSHDRRTSVGGNRHMQGDIFSLALPVANNAAVGRIVVGFHPG